MMQNQKNPPLIVVFSWPSANSPEKYTADEANLAWSTEEFITFLNTLIERKNEKSPLHIVSHSMGNRAMASFLAQTQALQATGNDRSDNENDSTDKIDKTNKRTPFDTVILANADVDFHEFELLKKALDAQTTRNAFILVSDRDRAIISSQTLHGQPRLGRPVDLPISRTGQLGLNKNMIISQLMLFADPSLLSDNINNSPQVASWLQANPNLGRDFSNKAKFIDVSELITQNNGHRLAAPVAAGLLSPSQNIFPLRTKAVYKFPDKSFLEQCGGSPLWIYRFHRIDPSLYGQK
jgi:hypothetical protein